jgi:hypothetical protein
MGCPGNLKIAAWAEDFEDRLAELERQTANIDDIVIPW